jgi:hypothetical protein
MHDLGIHHATIELEWANEHCGLEHHCTMNEEPSSASWPA